MKVFLQITCLLLYLTTCYSSLLSSFKNQTKFNENELISSEITNPSNRWETLKRILEESSEFSNRAKEYEDADTKIEMDLRRKGSASSSDSTSSSREGRNWESEFDEKWMKLKLEIFNDTTLTTPRGNQPNILAARPWGVPCGNPNQYDSPWGSCMLAIECDAEYRIYRGDLMCGQTRFVCCAVSTITYDTYQGFDISLSEHSLIEDSEEERAKNLDTKEINAHRKKKERERRKKERKNRKRKMYKLIKIIIKKFTRMLERQFSNTTKLQTKKTQQLRKVLKKLKKQFRHDREQLFNIRDDAHLEIDRKLHSRLVEIQKMNRDFVTNDTYREIMVNGTDSYMRHSAKMLLDAYPELANMTRRMVPLQPHVRQWLRRLSYRRHNLKHPVRHRSNHKSKD